jgi:effector-binding domain-containing protein
MSKKFLKISMIILVILATIVFVPPLFMASSYTASSSIVIESNSYNVFPYFADLKKWEKWSPWREKDTTTQYNYSENTFGAGSTMSWDSKNEELGTGTITTVQFKKFHHINYKLDFVKPFKSTSGGQFIVEKLNEKQVKVTWTNTGKLGYPMSRWFNTFMSFKKMLEKDFAHGLSNLKKLVESNPQVSLPKVEPETMELKEQLIYSVMHETVLNSEIGTKIGESYAAIGKAIVATEATPLPEPPLCLFYSHNYKTSRIRPGILVQGCGAMPKDVQCFPLREGKVLRFSYMGSYYKMEPTYDAINVYLEENNFQKREDYTWESYVTDPGMEPDTNKWLTYIYVPVKK